MGSLGAVAETDSVIVIALNEPLGPAGPTTGMNRTDIGGSGPPPSTVRVSVTLVYG
jgi:hypothetical protein